MKSLLVFAVFFNLLNLNVFAQKNDTRGAVYDLKNSVLTITESSLKQIDRVDNGKHALKILKGEIPTLTIKSAVEKILTSHNLFEEKSVMLSPASNLLVEFEGRVENLIMTHICRGNDGNYLAISVPDIYYSENFSVNIAGQERIINQLLVLTDPSTALLLQKKLLWGSVGDYWRFFLKQIDYDKKFKVRGLINFAGQKTVNDKIERLEIMIVLIDIRPIN